MKKSLFIMALGAIALTSCSQDEIIEVKKDAIGFSVATENASRAAAKTDLGAGDNFIVYANENDGDAGTTDLAYIKGIVATTNGAGGGNGEFKLAQTYYWPIKPLDFYCISPADPVEGTIDDTNNIPAITTYTVDSDHAEDLLYSVATGLKRGTTVESDGVADINFRHALSMIQFQIASHPTYDLDVTVSSIKLVNVAQTGAYALPSKTTSPNLATSSDVKASTVDSDGTRGAWDIESDAYTETYTWTESHTATAVPDAPSAAGTTYFLLPQTVTAATPADVNVGEKWSNAYFELACVIKKDDVTVYSGSVQIPVATGGATYTWKEGYKYLYTFTFGQGGGYYPGSDDPAIVPISFDITVDAMQDATQGVPVEVVPAP